MSKRKPLAPNRRPAPSEAPRHRRRQAGGGAQAAGRAYWLFGVHPVLAALGNARRLRHRLLLTQEAERRLAAALAPPPLTPERTTREDLTRLLGPEAVHQGIALLTELLAQPAMPEVLGAPADTGRVVLVALDQVTDPHNVGAILRSAAAFGARAVIAPRHHAAPETAILAKAASGALDHVPYIQVGNLARALGETKQAGFWVLGLAGDGETVLPATDLDAKVVIVLGAEGAGLRRLTREACDLIARLPTGGPIADLNVSNAAAVALYEVLGRKA